MKFFIKLIIISALRLHVSQALSDSCTTTCIQGEYCKDDICVPCPANSYQNKKNHKDTICIQWTKKPDHYGWVIKHNGSATDDVQWKCGDQYVMFEYTPGSYECRANKTLTPAATTTTVADKNTTISTFGSMQTRATTVNDNTSPSGDDLTYVYIITPILLLIAITVIVLTLWLKHKLCFSTCNTIQEQIYAEANNHLLVNVNGHDECDTSFISPELHQLFEKVINIIGIRNCRAFLIQLNEPRLSNSPRGAHQNLWDIYISALSHWVRLNPNINHAQRVHAALDGIGYKLPPKPEVLQDPATDISRLMISLEKAERLNHAFRRLLLRLVDDLGTQDGGSILTLLNLEKAMEFRQQEGIGFVNAFCATLEEWSYSYPCKHSDNGNQWFPLDELKRSLKQFQRNDILTKLENSANSEYNESELQEIIRNYFNPREN